MAPWDGGEPGRAVLAGSAARSRPTPERVIPADRHRLATAILRGPGAEHVAPDDVGVVASPGGAQPSQASTARAARLADDPDTPAHPKEEP